MESYKIYTTKGGEVIDEIVKYHYKDLYSEDLLERVMSINQEIVSKGLFIDEGEEIILPDVSEESTKESVTLW